MGFDIIYGTTRVPKERAEIRFVVDAGSILEDDDQCGLAHILEHMAFNGSTHFGARELVKFFESIGSRFGAHLNAQTGFDNTIYKLHIPTDSEEIIDKSLLVVQDWAQALLSFCQKKLSERDWLDLKNGVNGAVHEQDCWKAFSQCYSIQVEVCSAFAHWNRRISKIVYPRCSKRFYHDWYRPELMSIRCCWRCRCGFD